ncbi:Eco29kI family restriction endonuclease [Sulfitobacter sp. R18_1]|uniref:Eco29kI family restriction endonuclease n=1 Tax=Sulfitobacter sp. R18_1 TaxID=2821104 RepID=UPI001ADAF79B|nr:Eco29kI family restriction endonuclease [Sulfitobacter sp. R18_1]MBO9428147.1 Eco29kI family restriction endonuclease [Sulfitobacter sp. R18_1]
MDQDIDGIPGVSTFELNLPQAIVGQVTEKLISMQPASLLNADLNAIHNFKGIYCLEDHSDPSRTNKLVYVGKADGREGMQQRLKSHQRRIQMRENLDATKIYFKALHIFVFQPRDVEEFLIMSFQTADNADWNKNGFGTNDPGKNRDETTLKPSHFDSEHSIDLNGNFPFLVEAGTSVADSVRDWAQKCPWTCRNMGGLELQSKWKRTIECATPDDFLSALEDHMKSGSRLVAHPGRLYVPHHNRDVEVYKAIYGTK